MATLLVRAMERRLRSARCGCVSLLHKSKLVEERKRGRSMLQSYARGIHLQMQITSNERPFVWESDVVSKVTRLGQKESDGPRKSQASLLLLKAALRAACKEREQVIKPFTCESSQTKTLCIEWIIWAFATSSPTSKH